MASGLVQLRRRLLSAATRGPLSPRFISIKSRDYAFRHYPVRGDISPSDENLMGEIYSEDEFWSCTTCSMRMKRISGQSNEGLTGWIEGMDNLELIRGSEVFLEMATEPQKVDAALNAVATSQIGFARHLQRLVKTVRSNR